jgi:hypothetical protein
MPVDPDDFALQIVLQYLEEQGHETGGRCMFAVATGACLAQVY